MKPFRPSLAEHQTAPRNCPYCGKEQDAAMALSEGVKPPKPGDYLVCAYCANWGFAGEAGEWLMPTAEERLIARTDDSLMFALFITKQMIAKRKEQDD